MDKKIEIKDLNLDVPPQKGFRKGVTKKSIIKSLSEEDWHRIDAMKEADERKVENKIAYKLFVMSDQLRIQKEQLIARVREFIGTILELDSQIKKYKIDITKGSTNLLDNSGNQYSVDELKVLCFKMETEIFKSLAMLRMDLSKLYVYVGKKGLDYEVMFNEKEYQDTVDWVQYELSKTTFRLL